jgi:hypothetical protein
MIALRKEANHRGTEDTEKKRREKSLFEYRGGAASEPLVFISVLLLSVSSVPLWFV